MTLITRVSSCSQTSPSSARFDAHAWSSILLANAGRNILIWSRRVTLLMLVDFCTGRRGHHFRRDEGLAVRRALGAVPLHVLGPRRLVPLLVLTRRGLCGNQNLRRVRAESSRRPPRHRRDACSTAWRCEFLTARPSQDGRVVAEKRLSEELSGAPDALVDFHTGGGPPTASTRSKLGKLRSGTGTRTGASTMLLESTARWASLI